MNPSQEEEIEMVQLNLPYGGERGQQLMQKLQKNIKNTFKGKVQLRTTYTPCKLGSRFPVKDKTKLEHQHNVCYHIKCANKKYKSCGYVGFGVHQTEDTCSDYGPQLQRCKVTRPTTFEEDQTSTSVPSRCEDNRERLSDELQKIHQRSPLYQRAKTRPECPKRSIQSQTVQLAVTI